MDDTIIVDVSASARTVWKGRGAYVDTSLRGMMVMTIALILRMKRCDSAETKCPLGGVLLSSTDRLRVNVALFVDKGDLFGNRAGSKSNNTYTMKK